MSNARSRADRYQAVDVPVPGGQLRVGVWEPTDAKAGDAADAPTLLAVHGAASAQTVKVGSKNFTEQYILAEIYAQAIEDAGIKVERKINLGGTLIAQRAIVSGEPGAR